MSRQLYAANSICGWRGFSSVSDIYLNRCRPKAPAISRLGGRNEVSSYSTKSLSSVGGRRRISCSGSYWTGAQRYGDLYYGSPRNYIQLRNYAGNSQKDLFHGVSVNEHLLKPLSLGVDPEIQKIRIQEREQMKSLNTQFACFIDKVRNLERKNKMLVTKWSLLQGQITPVKKDLRPHFENSIRGLRRQLDFLLSEKGQMGPQLQNIQQCVEESKHKYEEVINRRAAAESDFVLLKKDVDYSFVYNRELEAQVAALKTEIEFLRCIYGEELSMLDERIQCETPVIVQMDNSRDLDMNCILQNVDSWYQSIVQGSKEEVNALYQSRFRELQNQRRQITDDLKKSKREVAELSRITQRLLCDQEHVKKQVACLQAAVFDTEDRGNCTLKDAQEKRDELHSALHKSSDELASMLRNYQALLNDKLALDIEIATYKQLLEREENRLISGNLVSKVPEDRSSAPGHSSLRGGFSNRNGKRKRGGPGMGKNHENVDCYPWGYSSTNVGQQCIPGGEEFNTSAGYSSGSSGNASRNAQRLGGSICGACGYDTTRWPLHSW